MSAALARLVLAIALIGVAPAAATAAEDNATGLPANAKLTASESLASPAAPLPPEDAQRSAVAQEDDAKPGLIPAATGGAADPGSKCAEFPMMCAAE